MSLNKVEQMVETYLNGNMSDFKKWLKKSATKQDVLDTVGTLANHWWNGSPSNFLDAYLRATGQVSRFLK